MLKNKKKAKKKSKNGGYVLGARYGISRVSAYWKIRPADGAFEFDSHPLE